MADTGDATGRDGDEAARIRSVYEARDRVTQVHYSDAATRLMREQRLRELERLLREHGLLPLSETRILDVGCGRGGWLADFEAWGAQRARLAGLDLSEARVASARELLPGADLRVGSGTELPWPDASFDLVVQATVFTSILSDEMRRSVAAEMSRVLAPGGAVLWYDFFRDNPRNPDVRKVTAAEIAELFPGFRAELKRITLAPPLLRRLAGRARPLAVAFERLRVLNTHYLGLLRRVAP